MNMYLCKILDDWFQKTLESVLYKCFSFLVVTNIEIGGEIQLFSWKPKIDACGIDKECASFNQGM